MLRNKIVKFRCVGTARIYKPQSRWIGTANSGLKEKAGLQESDSHFHDLRTKAGTEADNAGINAQKLLG